MYLLRPGADSKKKRVNIFINDGHQKKGKALIIPADFKLFLQNCEKKLILNNAQVFDESGHAISNIEEIEDNQILFISSGEPFRPILSPEAKLREEEHRLRQLEIENQKKQREEEKKKEKATTRRRREA